MKCSPLGLKAGSEQNLENPRDACLKDQWVFQVQEMKAKTEFYVAWPSFEEMPQLRENQKI